MSFFTNPAQQMTLDDTLFSLTARERKALENSSAKIFADDDIVEGLMLDVRLQYALHTTSFEEQPLF